MDVLTYFTDGLVSQYQMPVRLGGGECLDCVSDDCSDDCSDESTHECSVD